jgi:hypothetical protein
MEQRYQAVLAVIGEPLPAGTGRDRAPNSHAGSVTFALEMVVASVEPDSGCGR